VCFRKLVFILESNFMAGSATFVCCAALAQ
jgi:hypothetical protein